MIKDKLSELIKQGSLEEVNRITGEKLKEAAGMMNAGKADVSGGYASDAILNGPDILFDQLAAVFQSWCVRTWDSNTNIAGLCFLAPTQKFTERSWRPWQL